MARREDQKQYDVTIHGNFPEEIQTPTGPASKKMDLKYARNPGFTAALYSDPNSTEPTIPGARILNAAKDPGYINIEDADRALRLGSDLRRIFPKYVSGVVVKHEIPCGAGIGDSVCEAFENAWAGDPLSAFGGVVVLSEQVNKETAAALTSIDPVTKTRRIIEWVVAPGYTGEAMDILGETRIRLMEVDPFNTYQEGQELEVKRIRGGYLIGEQYRTKIVSPDFVEVKLGDPSNEDVWASILQWVIAGHTKSNAVVVGDGRRAYGIGSGQTSRVDAAHMALYKATKRGAEPQGARGLVAASDAFWPFPDGPALLAEAGVRGCIYPTGSNKDQEVLDEFAKHNMFVLIPRPDPNDPLKIERAFY